LTGRFVGVQSILTSPAGDDAEEEPVLIPAADIPEGSQQVREQTAAHAER